MGGSWARSEAYLKCGYRLGLSAGIRHPDVGFRPVREPESSDWGVRKRKLSAVPLGNGNVLLSWALLKVDAPGTRFDVYRASLPAPSTGQRQESCRFPDYGGAGGSCNRIHRFRADR
ncbi:hypothetical protein ES703_116051 [subsurface metagenome]